MDTQKKVTIVTIPLVAYHEQIYWGLYEEHTGRVRKHIRQRANAGRQVSFSFSQALAGDGDILIATDDKFNYEHENGARPSDRDYELFVALHSMPIPWLDALASNDVSRLVIPPADLACGAFTFSERKLLAKSQGEYGLPSECANEWVYLLDQLSKRYESIQAYIPKVCAKGICYATPYAKEGGIWTKPITISFTDKANVSSEYSDKG